MGTFEYKVSAGYLGVDLGQGNESMRDDYIEYSAEVARPFRINQEWTVTPYVSPLKYVPVAHNNPLYWIKVGSRIERTTESGMTVAIDFGNMTNVNSITAVPEREVRFAKLSVSKPVRDNFRVSMGVMYTQHIKKEFVVPQQVARDGRLILYTAPGQQWGESQPFTWFLNGTYTF